MKLLELFSGTHSIGKIAKQMGMEVVSLDRDLPADIKEDILSWDYTIYKPNHFDIITASPICTVWSRLRNCWVGRKCKTINPDGSIVTRDDIKRCIHEQGKPMVDKVFEILDYFKPTWWWIENPQTGMMKFYMDEIKPDLNFYDVDYCKYGFPYQKRTRFWTNIIGFDNQLCKKDCMFVVGNKHFLDVSLGNNVKTIDRYRIPPDLITELLSFCI